MRIPSWAWLAVCGGSFFGAFAVLAGSPIDAPLLVASLVAGAVFAALVEASLLVADLMVLLPGEEE